MTKLVKPFLYIKQYAHRMYGLKETTLANIIIKALSITPSSPDGEYLRHFKRPQKHVSV